MSIVTDVPWKDKSGRDKVGYYMDGYLISNLLDVPKFLSKDFDCISIVSASGGVRIGKSTIAAQICYFVAWLLAGGEYSFKRDSETGKVIEAKVLKSPNKQVKFDLGHIVFSAEDLVRKANELPPNSVILLDEARLGLDSKNSMSSLNKILENFFQECGYLNDFIVLCLPDFFKLSSDYAVNRSQFLIDCHLDENYNRGFFRFFNKMQKEKLYEFGKKRLGVTSKYHAATENFYGRFTKWVPFNEKEYKNKKKLSLKKQELGRRTVAIKVQRDCLISLYKDYTKYTNKKISEILTEALRKNISDDIIDLAIKDYKDYLVKKQELQDLVDEIESDDESSKNIDK
jgi:hypothetical protein